MQVMSPSAELSSATAGPRGGLYLHLHFKGSWWKKKTGVDNALQSIGKMVMIDPMTLQ